jgi:NSS family neurotransmitter:Na+ symporter
VGGKMAVQNGEVERTQWTSSFGFIIACVGSAVGLGNIWKFPYIAYENGGGAFVLVYLLSIIIVGFPIIIAELVIGRHAKMNAFGAFKKLSNNNFFWKIVGASCIFSAFSILSFYSVVAGWTLDYFLNSLMGNLQGLTTETVGTRFGGFVTNPYKQVGYHTLFMALTGFIVYKGTAGIEKSVKFLMPTLAVLVLMIAGISLYNYGASESLNFLFNVDFSTLTPHSILEAVGHSFFTLSLGMGAMLIYGSYLPQNVSLVKASFWITLIDTLVAIMACLMMYPIIFGTGMEVKESAAILFTTLTVQFNALPGGSFISALFYLLVAFAALSSTISLLELVVSFVDEHFKIPRGKGTLISSVLIWLVGLGAALGNGAVGWITKIDLMGKLDYLTSNWTLPVTGMLVAVFCGWFFDKNQRREEFTQKEQGVFFKYWDFSLKYISPVLVFIVVLYKIFK